MSAKRFKHARQLVSRAYREVLFWVQSRFALKAGRTVVYFPSNQPWDPASNLRAWSVAPALRDLGWRALVVPATFTLERRHQVLNAEKPDVVVLQQTRNPLNDPRLYPGYPCILDVDDADFLDPLHQARITEIVKASAGVVAGSRYVADLLRPHTSGFCRVIWTSTPDIPYRPRSSPVNRRPIVGWAHSCPLLYPREADFVQKVMTEVCKITPVEFWLFGSTESAAAAWFGPIQSAGGKCVAIPSCSYQKYLRTVAECAVGLQPVCWENEFSRGKSFGKVLAYLQGHVAVVASDTVDHPLFFQSFVNGVLLPNQVARWAAAIHELVVDHELRARIALSGYEDFRRRLSTRTFAHLVDPVLRSACSPQTPSESARQGTETT